MDIPQHAQLSMPEVGSTTPPRSVRPDCGVAERPLVSPIVARLIFGPIGTDSNSFICCATHRVMKWLASLLIALAASNLIAQASKELVLDQSPFAVCSAFWPNLHHLLWGQARRSSAVRSAVSGSVSAPAAFPLMVGDAPRHRCARSACATMTCHESADHATRAPQRKRPNHEGLGQGEGIHRHTQWRARW